MVCILVKKISDGDPQAKQILDEFQKSCAEQGKMARAVEIPGTPWGERWLYACDSPLDPLPT
jgi:hypothetical protein